MALILSNTETPITISGTTTELPTVYTRLEFGCRPNGTTMEIAFSTYEDAAMFQSGSMIHTNVPLANYTGDIDPLTQIQSVESAHALAKTHFEDLGYTVTVDL
jgi:hypothetical protein